MTSTNNTTLARPTTCIWCKRRLTDGRLESGWIGEGPDWMDDGDFGCDCSPTTSEDGVGRHIGRSSLRDLLNGKGIYTQEPLEDAEITALLARLA